MPIRHIFAPLGFKTPTNMRSIPLVARGAALPLFTSMAECPIARLISRRSRCSSGLPA